MFNMRVSLKGVVVAGADSVPRVEVVVGHLGNPGGSADGLRIATRGRRRAASAAGTPENGTGAQAASASAKLVVTNPFVIAGLLTPW
jgi:hypothetical protein